MKRLSRTAMLRIQAVRITVMSVLITPPRWWARVRSETWKVRSQSDLQPHQRVLVTGMDGLTLSVEPEHPRNQGE